MKKTIYLYQSGELLRQDSSLVLILKNGSKVYIPIFQIDQIICFSEITLNKRVLTLLSMYEISIIFFNFYGNYLGGYFPKECKNGKVLFEQVNAYQDQEMHQYISKQIIQASIKNQKALLKYYQKKGKNLNSILMGIDASLKKLDQSEDIPNVLMIEAQAKQLYYQAFDKIISGSIFSFEHRSKNPPENEFNSMLSYGYALLYSHYLSILHRSSLSPQISFVHSLNKSYDSLQYDLADILKPVIVDRLVLRMIRKNQVKKDMFDYSNDRCYLNKQGTVWFTKEFENQLHSTVVVGRKTYSYKGLISREVHLLSNYLKGESKSYKPYLMKW